MTEHGGVAGQQLRQIVERIERLEEEKKALADDIRDVYSEAKANGYDVKALRHIVKLRKQDTAERQEFEAIVDTYMHALGMLADTPLGQAAIERETGKSAPKTTKKRGKRPAADPESELRSKVHDALVEGGAVHLGGNQYRAPEKIDA
jgi:uncharacterized protein (UPF0335 family)